MPPKQYKNGSILNFLKPIPKKPDVIEVFDDSDLSEPEDDFEDVFNTKPKKPQVQTKPMETLKQPQEPPKQPATRVKKRPADDLDIAGGMAVIGMYPLPALELTEIHGVKIDQKQFMELYFIYDYILSQAEEIDFDETPSFKQFLSDFLTGAVVEYLCPLIDLALTKDVPQCELSFFMAVFGFLLRDYDFEEHDIFLLGDWEAIPLETRMEAVFVLIEQLNRSEEGQARIPVAMKELHEVLSQKTALAKEISVQKTALEHAKSKKFHAESQKNSCQMKVEVKRVELAKIQSMAADEAHDTRLQECKNTLKEREKQLKDAEAHVKAAEKELSKLSGKLERDNEEMKQLLATLQNLKSCLSPFESSLLGRDRFCRSYWLLQNANLIVVEPSECSKAKLGDDAYRVIDNEITLKRFMDCLLANGRRESALKRKLVTEMDSLKEAFAFKSNLDTQTESMKESMNDALRDLLFEMDKTLIQLYLYSQRDLSHEKLEFSQQKAYESLEDNIQEASVDNLNDIVFIIKQMMAVFTETFYQRKNRCIYCKLMIEKDVPEGAYRDHWLTQLEGKNASYVALFIIHILEHAFEITEAMKKQHGNPTTATKAKTIKRPREEEDQVTRYSRRSTRMKQAKNESQNVSSGRITRNSARQNENSASPSPRVRRVKRISVEDDDDE